jgi:hypothetical protein
MRNVSLAMDNVPDVFGDRGMAGNLAALVDSVSDAIVYIPSGENFAAVSLCV